ncbi:pre-rRNA-processing protein esf1 [Sporothrix curviconia]|uniref:Pre-rRNA-processing protein esf1 n=1 Tax=Sporothrix curviconia TaxID=1260050 RepID=A0ABP0BT67_9PEZI
MPPKKQKERGGEAGRISDERFAKFESDPRYRLPSRRDTKTKLDKRFGHVLKDKGFTATTQIDRYGRKIKTDKKKKVLQRLYEEDDSERSEEDEEDGSDSDDDAKPKSKSKGKSKSTPYDAARGGGFSASESEENSDGDSDDDEDDEGDLGVEGEEEDDEDAVDTQQFREEQAEVPTGEVTRRIAIVNLDWDHVKSRDLMAMFSSFVPTDGRGRIEKISVYPSQFGKERMQREELEGPPREIFKHAKKGGDDDDSEVDSDYSEESDQGSGDDDESEDDEKVKRDLLREEDDQDFDSNALRSYQLDRLRYYYAVMVCSDAATAEAIYRATDGSEYQSSSNFVDLRFVPDDVAFDDDEPRDECTEVPSNYKPVEFVTNALQHSKVKLTWDMHPEDNSRKDLMKKAFSGTPAELIENDLRAYLASDSDGDDDNDDDDFADDGQEFGGVQDAKEEAVGAEDNKTGEKPVKLSKKEQARQKMRAALGLAEEPAKKSGSSSSGKHGAVGGMQITFTPALSDGAAATKKKAAADGTEETTLEKYKRKEKERKEKRKQKAIAKREGHDVNAAAEEDDGDEDVRLAKEILAGGGGGDANVGDAVDLGFDDPFFTSEDPAGAAAAAAGPSKSSMRKEERLKKRAAREAEEREKEKSRAQLEALMGEDEKAAAAAGHFDLREVIKADKQRQKEERRKNRRNHNRQGHGDGEGSADNAAPTAYAHGIDMSDPRLQSVLSNAEFAIDPSNPHFKDTMGLQQLQNEARRKRKTAGNGGDDGAAAETDKAAKRAKKAKTSGTDDELAKLVKSVKSRAKKAAA